MGLALDPDFAVNGRLYLCYSTGTRLSAGNRLVALHAEGQCALGRKGADRRSARRQLA